MLYFRSCPRCQTGTVELSSDMHGPYLACLNCGFQRSGDALRKLAGRRATGAAGATRSAPSAGLPAGFRTQTAAVAS